MAKTSKIEFVCTDCGMNYNRWQGQCRCGAWNTLAEMKISSNTNKVANKSRTAIAGYAGGIGGGSKKSMIFNQLKQKSNLLASEN